MWGIIVIDFIHEFETYFAAGIGEKKHLLRNTKVSFPLNDSLPVLTGCKTHCMTHYIK